MCKTQKLSDQDATLGSSLSGGRASWEEKGQIPEVFFSPCRERLNDCSGRHQVGSGEGWSEALITKGSLCLLRLLACGVR